MEIKVKSKTQMKELLLFFNIPSFVYSLDGGTPNEAHCIDMNNDIWYVYYSERGKKSELLEFDNSVDAYTCLLNRILFDLNVSPEKFIDNYSGIKKIIMKNRLSKIISVKS